MSDTAIEALRYSESPNTSDCISRQAAIDRFQALSYDDWNQGVSTSWANAYSECAEVIRDLPAVDAVPVVRCRDCKYSYIFEPWEGKDAVRYCNRLRWAYAKDSDLPVYDDDFCSHGERREE